MCPAGDKRHIFSSLCQAPAKIAADPACTKDSDAYENLLIRTYAKVTMRVAGTLKKR